MLQFERKFSSQGKFFRIFSQKYLLKRNVLEFISENALLFTQRVVSSGNNSDVCKVGFQFKSRTYH